MRRSTILGDATVCPGCSHPVRLHNPIGCVRGECFCSLSGNDLTAPASTVLPAPLQPPSARSVDLLDPPCGDCGHRRGKHVQAGSSAPCNRCKCRNFTAPEWEGSIGPFPGQYGRPHVYARDVHSGAGNCVCGHALLAATLHVQAAPGVPLPNLATDREREEALQEAGRLRARVEELEAQPEVAEAVRRLDAIQGDADPVGDLGKADQLVLACVPAEVRDAYRRLVERASWGAAA